MRLLHIDSSITGQASASRQLTGQIVANFQDRLPGLAISYRDLEAQPLPHLDSRMIAGDASAAADLARNAELLEEFLQADIVVIGAPMYNFGISSQLKAWIDRIAVAGKSFRYTAQGPEGLAGGKHVIIASARGGIYTPGSTGAAMDFQENYLHSVFAFLGVTDVEIVRAEGIAFGPEQRAAAITAAIAAADNVTRLPALAA